MLQISKDEHKRKNVEMTFLRTGKQDQNRTETIVHHANHSFRAYMRWRVCVWGGGGGGICPSSCTYANVHTPEVNGLYGEK